MMVLAFLCSPGFEFGKWNVLKANCADDDDFCDAKARNITGYPYLVYRGTTHINSCWQQYFPGGVSSCHMVSFWMPCNEIARADDVYETHECLFDARISLTFGYIDATIEMLEPSAHHHSPVPAGHRAIEQSERHRWHELHLTQNHMSCITEPVAMPIHSINYNRW